MRLYIVRHADPNYENDTITSAGHSEAQALAKWFEREGLDLIYCSPMGRARETMQYTADTLKKEAKIEEWTRELKGYKVKVEKFEEMVAWGLHGEIIQDELTRTSCEAWPEISWIKDNPNIIEKYEMVKNASDEFLKRHGYERIGRKYRINEPNTKKIAVFCHAGFEMAWLSHLLNIPLPLIWSGFHIPSSAVTTILFEERTEGWAVPRCIGLAEVSHLHVAGVPVSQRGIKTISY